jgi:hypothetical protein
LEVFVLVEHRSDDPLAPLRLFRNRALASAMAVILVFHNVLLSSIALMLDHRDDPVGAGDHVRDPADRPADAQALDQAVTLVLAGRSSPRLSTDGIASTGTSRRRRGIWSCGSRSCAPARSSRPCWSAAAGWTRRCSRW